MLTYFLTNVSAKNCRNRFVCRSYSKSKVTQSITEVAERCRMHRESVTVERKSA